MFIYLAGYTVGCVGRSFAYVALFVFLRDVWMLARRAAVASRRASNLATHLPSYFFLYKICNFFTSGTGNEAVGRELMLHLILYLVQNYETDYYVR